MIKYENRNMSIDIVRNDINIKYMGMGSKCLIFDSWLYSRLVKNIYGKLKTNSLF